ncbi:MAG TPA: hypothetical protein VIZ43_17360 [Trebonia sp.]
MEVLIGFAVGYWVGTRQGREGLERAIDSVREIATHPETKRLLGEGVAAAAPLAGFLGKGSRNTGLAVIRGVIDEVIDRRGSQQAQAA